MPYTSVVEGNNEAISVDVTSIDYVELFTGIYVHPVEDLLFVTAVDESDSR